MLRLCLSTAVILISIGFAYGIGNAPPDSSFESFKAFHGKSYPSAAEEAKSRETFKKTAIKVAAHNEAFKQGKVSYTLELNKFSDIEPSVFNQRNGYKPPKNHTKRSEVASPSVHFSKRQSSPPDSYDWRDHNGVSPVKDQKSCGSCWAFSAVGGMESQELITGQSLVTLSEEQLIDCDTTDSGCNEGFYVNAWQYVQSNGGIDGDASYPYTAGGGNAGSCQFPQGNVAVTVTGANSVNGDDTSIIQALVTNGPISIGIDAHNLMSYSGGTYSCSGPPNQNHAVLAVGYTADYWIVKNSWGTDFGENGYFNLARGSGDCGLENPAYPSIGGGSGGGGGGGGGSTEGPNPTTSAEA